MYIVELIPLIAIALSVRCLQIIVNPPFVAKTGRMAAGEHHSAAIMTIDQKADKELFFGKNAGLIDYVACWYKKSSEFTIGTKIVSAFVSTSSICQGQQVEPIWTPLLKDGVFINFAYTNFKWETEATKGAYVFVVIVGFSHHDKGVATLYDHSVLCGNTVRLIPNSSKYHFGILTSNVHMAWMRTVGGYFGPSYR